MRKYNVSCLRHIYACCSDVVNPIFCPVLRTDGRNLILKDLNQSTFKSSYCHTVMKMLVLEDPLKICPSKTSCISLVAGSDISLEALRSWQNVSSLNICLAIEMEVQYEMFYGGSIYLLKRPCAYNSLVHNHTFYQK